VRFVKNSPALKILAALFASLALVLFLAACGSGDDDPVTQTVTTGPVTPPTPPPTSSTPTSTTSLPTAPTAPTSPTAPTDTTDTSSTTPTAPSGDLESRLPAEDAVSGLASGTARDLPTSQDLVDALYTANDPTKPKAEERYANAGYAGGVLRDQRGSDPTTGLALLRVYVVQLGSEDAAAGEVNASIEEIKGSTALQTDDLDVPDIPTARALTADTPKVLFVTFNAGPYLYGIQAFAQNGTIPQDEILAMATQLYQQGIATP
jgi:hypothetical protein